MNIFITGATGHIGRSLIPALLSKGHKVRCLVRAGSEKRLPPGVECVVGDPLRKDSFEQNVAPCDAFVQLVGVTHPSPTKADQFRTVDLVSAQISVAVAKAASVPHFVYLSVAMPAPAMHAYVNVRQEGEAFIRASGMNATFIRPWYVLGPGRRWPLFLLPLYWLLERIPATRASAMRLGFVTIEQMTAALVLAIEHPPKGVRILDVPAIRRAETEGAHL